MLLEYPYAQNYLFSALDAAPALFHRLLAGLTDAAADFRPDPDRFTIREILAHLADWEPVFRERLTRMHGEDCPTLPGYDEAAWAIEHDYAHADWQSQAELFAARRRELTAFLRTLSPGDWPRMGNRPEIGMLSIQDLALLIPLHDAYHLRQIVEWREKWKTQ